MTTALAATAAALVALATPTQASCHPICGTPGHLLDSHIGMSLMLATMALALLAGVVVMAMHTYRDMSAHLDKD